MLELLPDRPDVEDEYLSLFWGGGVAERAGPDSAYDLVEAGVVRERDDIASAWRVGDGAIGGLVVVVVVGEAEPGDDLPGDDDGGVHAAWVDPVVRSCRVKPALANRMPDADVTRQAARPLA